jgi:hypothetical protein
MTGAFELFNGGNLSFGIGLKAPSRWDGCGGIRPLPDKASAVEGIRVVRECAGMALITDLCPLPGDSHEGPVRTV